MEMVKNKKKTIVLDENVHKQFKKWCDKMNIKINNKANEIIKEFTEKNSVS